MSPRPSVHRFLRDKAVLLTGGTGFLGKVVVDRLLTYAPDLRRIYLLIRTPAGPGAQEAAVGRFENEVLTSGAFDALSRAHGMRWPSLAREKVVPVAGDVSEPRLGLSVAAFDVLTSTVDIVINSAASVVFDAPLDEAYRHNTLSVQRVAEFARACRAAVLVHVSTAFVAGQRSGRVLEGPLSPDLSETEPDAIARIVATVMEEARARRWDARTTRAHLVEAGMTRARSLGWHDNYTYTKALGEMVLARHRGAVPTTVIRPSIIESSLRTPAVGWLENLNVCDPLFVEYGRGRMPHFPFGVDTIYDIVPADLVANALLAMLPLVAANTAMSYYTVGSGSLNPMTGAQLYDITHEYFTRHPMRDRRGRPIPVRQLAMPTLERFREMYAGEAQRSATKRRLLYLADLYATYMHSGCVFDTTNAQRLFDGLDDDERAGLDFDVRPIDWRAYLQEVHIPGLRRHVLREGVRLDAGGSTGRG
ncbi:MAG: SDR family oxidoreductase [Vicinamibacterales bacterium]